MMKLTQTAPESHAVLTSKQRLSSVHMVTSEEVEQGRWSITDVVLPVPGSKVQYPAHGTAQVYAEEALRDGILLPGLNISVDLCKKDDLNMPIEASGGELPVDKDLPPDINTEPTADAIAAGVWGHHAMDVEATTPIEAVSPSPVEPQVIPKAVATEFSFAALTGDYRHVIVKPKAFEWQLVQYR
jgi:hypothetical protein